MKKNKDCKKKIYPNKSINQTSNMEEKFEKLQSLSLKNCIISLVHAIMIILVPNKIIRITIFFDENNGAHYTSTI